MTRVLMTMALAATLGLGAGVAEAQPKGKPLDVPLTWTPKEAAALPVVDLTGGLRRLRMTPLTDTRETPTTIGENPEKKPPVVVTTTSNVPQFVSEHLTRELKQLGLDIGPDGAERTLVGELMHFWVRDTGAYDATVRVKLSVRDAQDKELWTGIVTGRGENWGRQLKVINYTEAITTAVLDLVANLVKSPQFMATLRKAS